MVSNDDFDGKATHLNCFYLHINFEQIYPKPAIVLCLHFQQYKSLQKVDFFDHLPTSSCKRSLWTPPKLVGKSILES